MGEVAKSERLVNAIYPYKATVLGNTKIPQKRRSVRKDSARQPSLDVRPSKRRCASHTDLSEAAIAEMLLDLSNTPSSSPRESDTSTDDGFILQLDSTLGVAVNVRKSRRLEMQPAVLKSEGLEEASDETEEETSCQQSMPEGKLGRKVPGRCKCGKRVSSSHPPCKSELMLLCERFCERFGHLSNGEPSRIQLNECAIELGVPRRRLYDITIVYEAVEVVKRTGKLAYVWRGTANLPALISQLRHEEELGLPVGDRKGNTLLAQHAERQPSHSLWTLSRKFIRMLLTKEGPTQLSDAAAHLIGEHAKAARRQQTQITVERRLYDIGSILATLNLIKRTYVEGKRQPAFSWNWNWNRFGAVVECPESSSDRSSASEELIGARLNLEVPASKHLLQAIKGGDSNLSSLAACDVLIPFPSQRPSWMSPPDLRRNSHLPKSLGLDSLVLGSNSSGMLAPTVKLYTSMPLLGDNGVQNIPGTLLSCQKQTS